MMKQILFLFLVSWSLNQLEAQKTKFQPLFTAITVKNIDSSVLWYSQVLQLNLRNRTDNAVRGFKQAILINDGIMIELVELNKSISADTLLKARPAGNQIYGYHKFGMAVSDIETLFKDLSLLNIQFVGKMVTDQVDQRKTFLIQDPDGNLIQFFEQ